MPRSRRYTQEQEQVQEPTPAKKIRKVGTAETMEGTKVRLVGGTKLTFTMGEPINPKVADVRYIFNRIFASSYCKDLTPGWAVPELFFRCTMGQMAELVPAVLTLINDVIEAGEYADRDEQFLTVSAYVLAWWNHLNNGGARPLIESAREKRFQRRAKVILTEPEFRCPFCGTKWSPPKNMVRYTAMSKPYLKWLPVHFWEYHRWEAYNPKNVGKSVPEVPDDYEEPKRRAQ